MKILRKYIRMLIESDDKESAIEAAGVIVIKYIEDKPRVLILQRHDGTFDITKGKRGSKNFERVAKELKATPENLDILIH